MERSPKNLSGELLAQQNPETEVSFSAVVEGIREQTSRIGKKYHVLEFIDPNGELKKVSLWDKKVAATLKPGDPIDLTLVKKDEWWNLGSSTRRGSPKPPEGPGSPVEASKPLETRRSPLVRPADNPRSCSTASKAR